jgi:hypothetical protein
MPPVISTIVMSGLFARRQRTSMSVYFTNSLTLPTGLGLLASPRGGFSFGRAACGSVAPRKMACRSAAGGGAFSRRFKAINSRTEEGGSAGRCPFLIGGGNGRQDARPRSAHRPVALLHRRRLDLGLRYFGFGLFCARWSRRYWPGRKPLALTWGQLILKGAALSRSSGRWNDDDFDVLAGGKVVGRIYKAGAAPVGSPWMWTLAFGHHEDRTPTHGYEATRLPSFERSRECCAHASAAFQLPQDRTANSDRDLFKTRLADR